TSLVAAATVLAAGTYRAAAPLLAQRLNGKLEEPGVGWDDWNPQFAVLRALAVLGTSAEVPALAAVLHDPARRGAIRREALATLTALRIPGADREVRAFLREPPEKRPVWNPPSPATFLDLAAKPASPQALARAWLNEEPGDLRLRRAAGSFTADTPEGGKLLLFRDPYLGSPDDLWAAPLDAAGHLAGRACFTGVRLPAPEERSAPPLALTARVQGDRVQIRTPAGQSIAAFSREQLTLDTDGDGLTDLEERRLRLDPLNPDTDGDGRKDSEDPAPNARQRNPRTDDQEIAAALFRQFFLFDDGARPEIAVVVSDFALEWTGRRDLTLTLTEREDQAFLEETGAGGIPHITFHRADPAQPCGAPITPPLPPLAPDEDAWSLSLYRSPQDALCYRLILRNLNAGTPTAPHLWALREARLAGVL
nr:thrombospondin type 3 repeat-containing protein [Acidobacteriota bacterium]